FYLEAESHRYEFLRDIVDQYRPDVAIITLDSDAGRSLQLITQLATEFPQTALLAVSGRSDGPFILQTLRSGAKEFLTLPLQLEDLLSVLDRTSTTTTEDGGQAGTQAQTGGMTIAVTGSGGG